MGKRNLQGGNKTKAMAKSNTPYLNSPSRTPQTPEEKYAIVKSVSGSGRFRLISTDNKVYVGILPGSMRGHKKRNNYVALDSIVLINDRTSWQSIKHNSHADIIHVYTPNEIHRLDLLSFFTNSNIPPADHHLHFSNTTPSPTTTNTLHHDDTHPIHTDDYDTVNLDFI
jgi:hypothetical protein